MGQENTTTKSQSIEDDTVNVPTFYEANISLDEGSVLRPNGFFPPEIIIYIMQYTDSIDFIRSSQSCKLWYESVQEAYQSMYITKYGKSKSSKDDWKTNFFRRALSDRNLRKGVWWAEAISTIHVIGSRSFSYVVSFEDNKVIVNHHIIHISSYTDTKSTSAAYLLDLDTMKREPIPYGTIFANGFKITTPVKDDFYYFNWIEFQVDDGTTKRTIRRKHDIHPPNQNNVWAPRTFYKVFANKDGSPTVMTTNTISETLDSYEHIIEVVDLRTGEIIAELQMNVYQIRGLIGDEVMADFADGLHFVNIFTNERRNLPYVIGSFNVHYCQESHQIGFVETGGGIIIHEWPSLKMVSQIDIFDKIDFVPRENNRPLYIKSFSFDKSKLVVALTTESTFFAVFDIHTGKLIQTFFNPSDGHDRVGEGDYGTIHLAPNGKIVIDFANLTVYDFVSPKINKKIPVVVVEPDIVRGDIRMADKAIKSYVPAVDLVDFAIKKLNSPIEYIMHRTLFKEENGVKYRLTGIGSHVGDQEEWAQTKMFLHWMQLAQYLEPWKYKNEVKNTFQLTKCNVTNPAINYHTLTWTNLRNVILVYERFNETTKEWEFTEPIGLKELAEKGKEDDELMKRNESQKVFIALSQ